MKVLKFGGSSVGTAERIENVIQILKTTSKKDKFAVVFSAFQGVTDLLLQASAQAAAQDNDYLKTLASIKSRHLDCLKKLLNKNKNLQKKTQTIINEHLADLEGLLKGIYLIKECPAKTADTLVSFGERMSNIIIASALNLDALPAEYLDARSLIKTDDNYQNAEVNFTASYKNIAAFFKNFKKVAVVTGFIGSTDDGCTTTLGRGGSDYTAAIFGAALNCKSIEIWTDVDGVLSADPRKVQDAFVLEDMSYEEAMEMSHFGAKVLHPKTMAPAVTKKIPIIIKNSFNPQAPGTKIWQKSSPTESGVKGVTSLKSISLLNLHGVGLMGMPGIANRLFKSIAGKNINVILISQASSEHSICLAVVKEESNLAIKAIEEEFKLEIQAQLVQKISRKDNLCTLAVVGDNMQGNFGIAAKLFHALGRNGTNIIAIAQGSSERNISFVIEEKDEEIALNAIHDAFFLKETKLHVFLVGIGVVGGQLLEQIKNNQKELKNKFGINLALNGVMNSKKMLIAKEGLNLSNLLVDLDKKGGGSNFQNFLQEVQALRLHNAVLVDCTSNAEIAQMYQEVFAHNLHIVTPNKKANSDSYQNYQKLHQAKRKYRKEFLYETNVGAALPVINTLQDLVKSGDKIIKIEGILSGTLSFIFNNYDGKQSFSEIVKSAKEKGYTEPDPREDLSGQDFARKMLILAREIGLPLEMKNIKVENLSPLECQKANSVEEFFWLLPKYDQEFLKKLEQAKKKNCLLRYLGKIENNQIEISLQEVPSTHPFAALLESDNIVAFTTERYHKTPLVVRGPGAGPSVTAGGVFADILRIAHNLE